MHFKIAKSAQSYFNNIMNLEGSHAAEDKSLQAMSSFMHFPICATYCTLSNGTALR